MSGAKRTGLNCRLLKVRFGMALLSAGLVGCQVSEVSSQSVQKPTSYLARKYAVTVRQLFDFSCGGAALATIFTHYWNRPTLEVEVLDILKSRYPGQSWKALQDKGFSLDDLIWTANKLGFEAQAASIPAEELEKLEGPIIVHLKKDDYEHFTVLRLRKGGRTYLSDPVLGAISWLNDEFDREYTGSALAVWKKSAPLPKAALLARPFPALDPSTVVGGALNGRQPDFTSIH